VYCASVTYPIDSEGFDLDYFATQHAPMFARLLGGNCIKFEVHRALATPGAPPPQQIAAAYFWVESPELFGAALARHAEEIYSDIARFSQTQPTRGWWKIQPQHPQAEAD
jgi:uncharacterized protein (TIGR02118 family)